MFDPLDKATLKPVRHYLGMTQEQLASDASCRQRTISDIEKGKDAKLSTWLRIVSVIRAKLEEKDA